MALYDDLNTCPTCHNSIADCTCSRTDDEAKGAADELGLEDEDKDKKERNFR
jgi:hypothetical protein